MLYTYKSKWVIGNMKLRTLGALALGAMGGAFITHIVYNDLNISRQIESDRNKAMQLYEFNPFFETKTMDFYDRGIAEYFEKRKKEILKESYFLQYLM